MVHDGVLQGVIDLHLHLGPDPYVPRFYDVEEAALRAAEAGMGGFVFKSHSYDTAPIARVVGDRYPSLVIAGGITLDPPVGGLNPRAVEAAARLGARVVWMPTGERPSVMDDGAPGKLAPGMMEILEIVRDHGMILATGHLPAAEVVVLTAEARAMGVRKVVVTHAMNRRVGPDLPIEAQWELAEMGAYIEHCATILEAPKAVALPDLLQAIAVVGDARVVLSSDFGKRDHGDPIRGFEAFAQRLLAAGLTVAQVGRMTRETPRRLLET